MNYPYPWAANLTKLRRAEAHCGVTASEEMILEAYRKMGGLVIDNGPMVVGVIEEAPVIATEEQVTMPVVEEALVEEALVEEALVEEALVEEALVEEAPKKKTKK
jgi:hypothetical protein